MIPTNGTGFVTVPDMSYDGLEISDDDTTMAVFAFMALGNPRHPQPPRKVDGICVKVMLS